MNSEIIAVHISDLRFIYCTWHKISHEEIQYNDFKAVKTQRVCREIYNTQHLIMISKNAEDHNSDKNVALIPVI